MQSQKEKRGKTKIKKKLKHAQEFGIKIMKVTTTYPRT